MITHFHIKNFRSCPDWRFSFGKKTYIMGENGSGKTHILDVLHFLGGSSFVYSDNCIDDESFFEVTFEENFLAKSYTFYQQNKKGIYAIQGIKTTKPKYIKSLPFRTVFVSPFDMNLLYFAPSMRRDYIDSILERSFEQFRNIRRDYEGVMRQRNALLKRIKDGKAQARDLDFWDTKFAQLAETYLLYRNKFADFLKENSHVIQQDLPKYSVEF